MKNFILSLLLLFFACMLAAGQASQNNFPASVNTSSGAPSGNCQGTNAFIVNTANGNFYDCPTPGSAWVLAGNVAAGGGVTSITGDGTIFNNSGSTGAVTLTLANTPTGTGSLVLSASPTITGTLTLGTLAATTISGGALSGTFTGSPTLSGNPAFTGTPTFSNTLALNTTGSAASLSISGQTGLLTVTGLTGTNRVKTVRDAADTILELAGSYTPTGTWTNLNLVTPTLGTPASGVITNLTGTCANCTANLAAGLTGTPNITVGTINESGGLTLSGASGAATTISTSTTNANLILSPNGTGLVVLNNGACTTPSLNFSSNNANTGFAYGGAANVVNWCGGGNNIFSFLATTVALRSAGGWTWSSTTSANGAQDTGIWRDAAAVVDFGTQTAQDTSAKLQAAGYISKGTKFTNDTGCGTIVTSSGGATAGKFTTVGSTSCTTVVTLGNSATSPNGWSCWAHDLTTSADYNNPHVSSSTTTITIVTGTIVSGDVIEFGCVGY